MGSRNRLAAIGIVIICCLTWPLANINAHIFGPVVKYSTSHSPRKVMVTNLFMDDTREITLIGNDAHGIEIIFLNNDGSYLAQAYYDASDNISSFVAEDFNSDGEREFAITEQSYSLIKIYRLGGSGFELLQTINCPGQPYDILAQPLDAGSTWDLFVGCIADNTVKIFQGNGDGTFSATYHSAYSPSPARVQYLIQPPARIAVPSWYADSMATFHVGTDGTIYHDETIFAIGGTRNITPGIFIDDGSSYRDLALVCRTDSTVKLATNDHSNNFSIGTFMSVPDFVPFDIVSADFDRDTKDDLAVIDNSSTNQMVVATRPSDWTAEMYSYLGLGPRSIAASDLNNDFYYDLVITFVAEDSVGVLINQLGGFHYVTGDVNNSGNFNGLDAVYSVAYFKGGPPPPYSVECTPRQIWYVAGDVNASCNFNGLDVSYMVSYFKGGPRPNPCPDCPPAR